MNQRFLALEQIPKNETNGQKSATRRIMKGLASAIRGAVTDWQFLCLVLLLVYTTVSIVLDIFLVRQVLGFITFTILPGYLILAILKLDRLSSLRRFLLSVGLGVAFLMAVGLAINTVYFAIGFENPLSTQSLTFSFSAIVFFLILCAYKVNKGNVLPLSFLGRLRVPKRPAHILLPVLFPVLAIAGTRIMNYTEESLLLLLLYFLIIGYSVAIFVLRPKHRSLYPISLWMISIASVLMLSLRSDYLIGYDVHLEYRLSSLTLGSLHWSPSSSWGPLGANLTVGLLPAVYSSLLGIDLVGVYKVVFALIYSITPLVIFEIVRGYSKDRIAFAASLFFIFQSTFAFVSQSNPRTAIAILFFGLAIMMLLDKSTKRSKKMLLVILLVSSVMISHYTTTFLFLAILAGVSLGSRLPVKWMTNHERIVRASLPVLFFALIFFWYGQMTGPAFTKGVQSVYGVFENLGSFLLLESRHEGTMYVMGVGSRSMPDILYALHHYVIAAIIGIGVLTLASRVILKRERLSDYIKKANPTIVMMMIICSSLLVAMILLPLATTKYTMDRLWTQMLVLLSGAFIIGCVLISAGRRRRATIIIAAFLVIQFLVASHLVHQSFGEHKSMIINSDGPDYSHFYVHAEEIAGALWLRNHMNDNLTVFTDFDTSRPIRIYGSIPQSWFSATFFARDSPLQGDYLFLGYYEIVHGEVFTGKDFRELSSVSHLFADSNRIYENGGGTIYN